MHTSPLPPPEQVSIEKHTFDMDFYLTEEWKDGRNYSALFADENLVELEPDSCEEQRTARSARNLLSTKRNIDGQERRPVRRLVLEAEISFEGEFNPGKGDVVKYFNEHAGTTYTATIKSLSTDADGKVIYNIEYTDEAGFPLNRPTFLETLSSMPQPARRFVEFGHDEIKLIWEPDVHITNLHKDMLVHEEVPAPRLQPHLPVLQSHNSPARAPLQSALRHHLLSHSPPPSAVRSCSACVTDCHIELGTRAESRRSAALLIPCSPLALSDEDGHVEFIRFVWAKFDMHEQPVIGKRVLSKRLRSATQPPLAGHPSVSHTLALQPSHTWFHAVLPHRLTRLESLPYTTHENRTLSQHHFSYTFSHAGHPVDTLMLEIHISSLSHSTKRITIHKHPTMNGLEESLVDKWCAHVNY